MSCLEPNSQPHKELAEKIKKSREQEAEFRKKILSFEGEDDSFIEGPSDYFFQFEYFLRIYLTLDEKIL